MRDWPTVTELLQRRARQHPDRGYLFLDDGEREGERSTFAELWTQARALAVQLRREVAVGERALLLFPPGLDFIRAFFGCLAAGVVAVPAYPPGSRRTWPRLRAVAGDARPALALAPADVVDRYKNALPELPELEGVRLLAYASGERLHLADEWTAPAVSPGDAAFLQYTSGSTSDPKGVVVTHANLCHNGEMIRRAFGQDEGSVVVGWLPLYHDMGLIGNVLQPLFAGARCVLMSPASFLQRPVRWLRAISTYRATTSGGPDFAFDLCVRKVPPEERAELDLSSWTVAFDGAEPVRAETLERFAAAFEPCGFRREAFYPCYGLAEATLFVSGGEVGSRAHTVGVDPRRLEAGSGAAPKVEGGAERLLVGCGRAWSDQTIAIADPETGRELPNGAIGEIRVAGASVADGYWGRPEETARTFRSQLADGRGPFLRTGDLGFVRDGGLFVTGRIKDLIVLRGRNLYPQDLEATAVAAHDDLRAGGAVAFSVPGEAGEELVIACELHRRARAPRQEVVEAVRAAVAETHGARAERVVLLRPGQVPRTSSGKLRRAETRARYLAGDLGPAEEAPCAETGAGESEPPTFGSLDEALRRAVARVLETPVEEVRDSTPLTALGLDSLGAARLGHELAEAHGVRIAPGELLDGIDLAALAERCRRSTGDEEALPPLEPGPPRDELPLTPGQRALWFLARLAPDSAAYHLAAAARVLGPLDAAAIEAAFRALVARHASLRTTFHAEDGRPFQRVHAEGDVDLSLVDASGWSDDELARALRREAYRPFDLERGPLLRVGLFRRAEEEHALVLSLHHLVADFWSLAVLVEELDRLYAAGESTLLPLRVGFSDYERWQRGRLEGPRGEALADHWARSLTPLPPDLDLPTDCPRPPVASDRGGEVPIALDSETTERLESLARERGATPFVVLLAGVQALLARWSGQDDLVVGCPAAGREAPGSEGIVGYFVNPVPVRVAAAPELSFGDLVERARRSCRDAFDHGDYPFPLLAERLRVQRDPSRSPLFQVLVTQYGGTARGPRELAAFVARAAGARLRLGDLELRPARLERPPVQLDLELALVRTGEGVRGALRFNRDLFDATTGRRLAAGLARLLTAAASRPALALAELPLLGQAERQQAILEWNDTAGARPGSPVHEQVRARAERAPEAIALVGPDGEHLSYGELVRRAARLAEHLAALGAGPEVPVAVRLERSPAMVVALLGVWMAGGAYLPLDPAFPAERLERMLEDSGTPLVLAASADSPSGAPRHLLLDRSGLPAAAAPVAPVRRAVPGGDALAYRIYTSGSTGRPKGVEVRHAAVATFLSAMARRPGLAASDVLLSVTTPSFDIAVLELFLPLVTGGRVALADRRTAADGGALGAALRRHRATVMQATPATWRLLLAAGWRGGDGLRVLCGGEALPRELADRLLPAAGEVWNLYGPTETTVWSAVERVPPAPEGGGTVSVGRPIPGTRAFLVDPRLRPVPIATAGELVLGEVAPGAGGVARGYRRRPAVTAERFVPDPFAAAPGCRLYRTGDLARRRADGRIEYLGRFDHQVKVRGHRIELGEVEAALAAHPAVAQAVAAVRDVAPGDRRLVAYVVAGEGARPEAGALREHLRERLPAAAVPSELVVLDALPLTPNGKVDRRALPAPAPSAGRAAGAPPRSDLERRIAAVWREVLGVESVGVDDSFFELGGHSLLAAEVHARLRERLGLDLTLVDLFRYPTVGTLARALARNADEKAPAPVRFRPPSGADPAAGGAMAVVGMAGRFPGAATVDRLWQRLRAGEECLTLLSRDELVASGVDPALADDPAYVRTAGLLEDADRFDARFFGFTPREAELMDPQHRVFLECAWHALEDAGYDPARFDGRIGLFAAAGINAYLLHAGAGDLGTFAARYQAFVGNDKDFVPTRASYKLGLTGPSVAVQTACSSSLVAVHLARSSLLLGECEMALAGGVSVRVPLRQGHVYEEGGIGSPDGHCRPFDAGAGGTVFGSGVGLVVLKPLARALADGDTVHGVVLGSAINNDGALKVGYTAPSVEGQAEVIARALESAGVDPASVSYVEAHGTGTAVGDPIEVAALAEALGRGGPRERPCVLGSVKGNLGHLDTAAGVAGLIKTVQALRHGELPPTLHFRQPNPRIDLAAAGLRVDAALTPWHRNGGRRRAGVSSFGIGGTNAHVVLEEAPAAAAGEPSPRPCQVLALSAATPTALDRLGEALASALGDEPERAAPALPDAAFTLAVGRKPLRHRRVVVCRDAADAAAALADPARRLDAAAADATVPVAFLLPGQGAQHPGMGAGLYAAEPAFRGELDRCARILEPWLGLDLRPLLDGSAPGAGDRLAETWLAQPAIFAVSWAVARTWGAWGVAPDALLGHSLGEYVAATLAGVWSLEDALRLVAARGRLMQACPRGSMLSVSLPEREVPARLGAGLTLAAVNGPRATVVSGPDGVIEAFAAELAGAGVHHRRLHTSHAFHSALMDPMLERFGEELARVPARPPELPVVSNVTGTWLTGAEATDPAYWLRQLRGTVRFADGLATLLGEPDRLLLEAGPGTTLTELARQGGRGRVAVSSLAHPRAGRPEPEAFLEALGRLWIAGVAIDWPAVWAGERRRRVRLPGYPFERERYWLERAKPAARPPADPATGEAARRGTRFYVPLWQEAPPLPVPAAGSLAGERWLLLGAEAPAVAALAAALRLAGGEPIVVARGEAFARAADGTASLAPGSEEGYRALLAELTASGGPPVRVVHAWSLTDEAGAGETLLASLTAVARALERIAPAAPVALDVVTDRLHRVGGEGGERPEQALLLGALRVLPQEMPALRCRAVDLGAGDEAGALARDLLAELASGAAAEERVVAHREGRRWRQGFGPLELPAGAPGPAAALRPDGAYLVTGGLGGLGLLLARALAERGARHVILLGRSGLPARERWDDPAVAGDRRIAGVRAIEAAGAAVTIATADVADEGALARALAAAEERSGPIRGVVHAAGVPGGALVQARDREAARAVLAPKVAGTRALAAALSGLDFVLLCSSINAVAGGLGQADYAAANAFCDAFAASKEAGRLGRVLSVGWDRWEGIGMAAPPALVPLPPPARPQAEAPESPPLLGAPVRGGAGRELHRSVLDAGSHWALAEHRVLGRPTLPGTACLEMVRAAFAGRAAGRSTVFRDVLFPAPLTIDEGSRREVVTVLAGGGDGYTFQVLSRPDGDAANLWHEHARGRVEAADPAPVACQDLARLTDRFREPGAEAVGAPPESGFLETGPRWRCLSALAARDGEVLATLELDPRLAGDLEAHALHPALLDVAVGAVRLLAGGDYLPLAYDALAVHRPLARRCFSHARLRGRAGGETIRADLTILDDEGRELAEVTGFSMRRVGEEAAASLAAGDRLAPGVRLPELEPALPGSLGGGLAPEEGVDAFLRVLAGARSPHLVVASRDLAQVVRERDAMTPERAARELAGASAAPAASGDGHARPELATSFVEPDDEVERRIAAVWVRVLGVERVGRHDNFFELGGSSLTGVQLVAELKRELGIDELPTVTVFEAPTVSALARLVRAASGAAERPAFQAARDRAEKKKRALAGARPEAGRRVAR